MTDIELVREALLHSERNLGRLGSDRVPLRLPDDAMAWKVPHDALAALDSLEAELAQAHATLNAIELLLGRREGETGWDAIKRLQAELAQVREREVGNLTALRYGVKAYNALLKERDRLDALVTKLVRQHDAERVEAARYREALENYECWKCHASPLTEETP